MRINLNNNGLIAILFTTHSCGACHPIDAQISSAIATDYPKIKYIKLNLEENPELRGSLLVFSAPTFLLMIDGKELLRESGVFSVIGLLEKIERIYTSI